MSRPSLRGIHLRADGPRLIATSCDGYQVARCAAAAQGTLVDGGLTLPSEVIKPLMRLLRDASTRVALRASQTLLEIAGGGFVLTSKLIDDKFPDLRKVIPDETRQHVTVARAELSAALERLDATVPPKEVQPPTIDLEWSADVLRLSLPERADEELDASDVAGSGRVTVKLQYHGSAGAPCRRPRAARQQRAERSDGRDRSRRCRRAVPGNAVPQQQNLRRKR